MNYKPNENRTVPREKFADELDLQTVFSVLDNNRIVEELQPKRSPFSSSQFSSLERAQDFAYEIFIENYRNKLKQFKDAKNHRKSYWYRFAFRFLFQRKYRDAIMKFNKEMKEIERLSSIPKDLFFEEKLVTQRLSETLLVKQTLQLGAEVFILSVHDFLRAGKIHIIQDEIASLNITNISFDNDDISTIMVQYHTKLGHAFDFENSDTLPDGEWSSSSANHRLFANFDSAHKAAKQLLGASQVVFINNESDHTEAPWETKP